MKLRRLRVDDYLLLHDLDLCFDRPGRLDTNRYALDFLVGVNGSGKSTVFRSLCQIISDLRAGRTTGFSYGLDYQLHRPDGSIYVSIEHASGEDLAHMTVRYETLDAEPVYDEDAIDQSYLPNRLVVYTTGSEAEWERLFGRTSRYERTIDASAEVLADPIRRFVAELPGHLRRTNANNDRDHGEPPFMLVRASRLPLVTLCGLLAHLASEKHVLRDVLQSVGLQRLSAFTLRFRLHTALSDRKTFDVLKTHPASRAIRQGSDHLLVFELGENAHDQAVRLLDNPDIGGSLGLFEKLERLMEPGRSGEPTLQEINLVFQRDALATQSPDELGDDDEATLLFLLDWLSDGEQSFLGRMAMLAMLDTEDSLILLDEPEVHFNDYWKREIVDLLHNIMEARSNHILITTHSSIVLSDVTESHIAVLVRNDKGRTEVREAGLRTLAADPGEIMSAIFQTELSIGSFATKLLDQAMASGTREEILGLLQRIGPGIWRFRLQQRLGESNASST